jgi:lysine decarboxylase
VTLADAVGRVAAETVTPYPPGVPLLAPGERVTAAAVALLREMIGAGVHLHGCSDERLDTLRVVSAG